MSSLEIAKNIVCPICQGSGAPDLRRVCPNCAGAGLGFLQEGRLYYWQAELGQAHIYLRRLKVTLDILANLFLFGLSLAGLWTLVEWLNINQKNTEGLLQFLDAKSPLLLIFWLGVLSAMYLLYRLQNEIYSKQQIKYFAQPGLLNDQNFDVGQLGLARLKPADQINILTGYRLNTIYLIEEAYLLARKLKHAEIGALHLLLVILQDREVTSLLYRLDVELDSLNKKIKHQLQRLPVVETEPVLSINLRQTLIETYFRASSLKQKRVKAINLVPQLIKDDRLCAEIFYDFELDLVKIDNAVAWFRINDQMRENYRKYKESARFKPTGNMDRAYTAIATPLLNAYGRDLTMAAKFFALEYCVERNAELAAIFAAFESGRHGVLLVGEEGVGKKTLVGGIAQLMVEEEVPELLKDKRLVELDVARLVSGAGPAQAEERLLQIMDEINASGNIIIAIHNIETIVGISAGGEQSLDLADVLVNAIEQAGVLCIATVTHENYLKFIENKPLGNALLRVNVAEPEFNQAIVMLESKVARLENIYNVSFTYGALEQAVKLTTKYIHDKYLPTKAIEVLELLAVGMSKQADKFITKEEVARSVSKLTGVPLTKVGANEGKELLKLEEKMHEQMIGQNEAVDMVAASLRRSRTQLTEGKRPIASFLFLGPTGVGKTELAKTLAKVYFGGEQYMVRLDMSEYQAQSSIAKMIGTGDDDKGYLTEAVRQQPFCLLLLDEFEKAHPDILNLFLQVMDDGRLTDGAGKTIDFTNCIIIATSNAGANYIQDEIKKNTPIEVIKEAMVSEHLTQVMRPELINRFDGLIVFRPLTQLDILAIAKLALGKIAKNLLEKGINMRFTEQGAAVLANLGYDVKFGARPLRRLLQERIENKIADKMLAGELKRRDTVVISDQGGVLIEKAESL